MIWLGIIWFILLIIGLICIALLFVQFSLDLSKRLDKGKTDYYIHCIKPITGRISKVTQQKKKMIVEANYYIKGKEYTVSTTVKVKDNIKAGKKCEMRYNPKDVSQAYFIEVKG